MDDEPPLAPANQRESYPKFDIIDAKAAIKRTPASVCLFSFRKQIIGQLFIYKIMPNSVVVNYCFAIPRFNFANSQALFRTVVVDNYVTGQRPLLQCPTCRRNCQSVYYNSNWACAHCLTLHYRSQLVDKTTLLWERRDAIHTHVRHGRPKGMHRQTFVKLKAELLALNAKLDGQSRSFVSEVHDQIVSSTWAPAASVDLWFPNFTVRGGHIVRQFE